MFVYELTERYGLTDEEVRNNLNLLPYYEKFDSKLITFIELELNNYGSKEKVSSENSTKEHVLPQTMTANWRIHLGTDKADKIHRLYLHNIGNICLTGYNSELGNDTFKSKKVLYEDSVFPLTRKLAEYEVWNEESICNYRDYKIDLFLKIFSVPDISQMKFGLKTSDKITSSDEAYAK